LRGGGNSGGAAALTSLPLCVLLDLALPAPVFDISTLSTVEFGVGEGHAVPTHRMLAFAFYKDWVGGDAVLVGFTHIEIQRRHDTARDQSVCKAKLHGHLPGRC
jgi:hypothetical protein